VSISSDPDKAIQELIEFLNSSADESAIDMDEMLSMYKAYLAGIVKLSAAYQPVKDEYDSIYKDSKQRSYLSEFT
jgi:hypothetical protein